MIRPYSILLKILTDNEQPTRAFLHALCALIKPSDNKTLVRMIPALEQAIKKVN